MSGTHGPVPDTVQRSQSAAAETERTEDATRRIETDEPRNLVVLVVYQVLLRVGWIFKTETVIMPSFLDMVGGAGWLRGCLPILSRFGQSAPSACPSAAAPAESPPDRAK